MPVFTKYFYPSRKSNFALISLEISPISLVKTFLFFFFWGGEMLMTWHND